MKKATEWIEEFTDKFTPEHNEDDDKMEAYILDLIQRIQRDAYAHGLLGPAPEDHSSDCATTQHSKSECTCGVKDRLKAQGL